MAEKILEIKNLSIDYVTSNLGKKSIVHAVDNLSCEINEGEIFAIAGESGCGKSTLSKSIVKLVNTTSGQIIYKNKDIKNFDKAENKKYIEQVQMIFQNPYASLNPKMTIKDIIKEPLIINKKMSAKEMDELVIKQIYKVGLCEEHLNRYPFEFSGGQRQRIAIARALIMNPEFIIADEPVSALDASIQAQIINLIKELKQHYNMTILFISHDMNVIKYLADRVAIMYLGEIVEIGTRDEIFSNPLHPYTKLLLNSIPNINKKSQKADLSEITNNVHNGCKFYARCKNTKCQYKDNKPMINAISETHKVLCPYYNS